jgi:hypothetical protein
MFTVKCYKHAGKEFNLRVLIEDLIEIETKRAGKGFANQDAPMTFSDASRIFNASLLVMRVLGWAWRWAEWWVEHGSNWEPLLEPGQIEEEMSPEELKRVDSTQESRRDDARRCRLAAFGAALRNREYDVEDNGDIDFIGGFDHRSLQQALRAVLHTPSLVGPLEDCEIDFLVDSLGRAYRSKSRLLAFGSDKLEIGNKGGFCQHKKDETPKYELGARTLPGKQGLAAGEIFEEHLDEVDDFDFYIERMAQNNPEHGPAAPETAAKTKKNRGKRGPGRHARASSPVDDPPKEPAPTKPKLRARTDASAPEVPKKRGRPPNPKRVGQDVVSDDKAEETPLDTSAPSGEHEDQSLSRTPVSQTSSVPLRNKIERTRTRKRQRSAAEEGPGEASEPTNYIPSSLETAEEGELIVGEVTDGSVGTESQAVTKDETPAVVKRGPGRPPKNEQTEEGRSRKRRRVLSEGTTTLKPTVPTETSVDPSVATAPYDTAKNRSRKKNPNMSLGRTAGKAKDLSEVAEASELADEEARRSGDDDGGEGPFAAVVEHGRSEDSPVAIVALPLVDGSMKPAAAAGGSKPQASTQSEASNEVTAQASSAENAPDEKKVQPDKQAESAMERPPTEQKEGYIIRDEAKQATAIKEGDQESENSMKQRQIFQASPTENAADEQGNTKIIESIVRSNVATLTGQEGHQASAKPDGRTNGNSQEGDPEKEAAKSLTEAQRKPVKINDQDRKKQNACVDSGGEEAEGECMEERLDNVEAFLSSPGTVDSAKKTGQRRGRLLGKLFAARNWGTSK